VGSEATDALRCGGIDLDVRGELLDDRGGAGVVHLHMVADEDIDLGRIDHGRDAGYELVLERDLGRIDERHLLVHDQIGVVGDAVLGLVAVEAAGIPVERAHPIDIGLYLNCSEHGDFLS
jgi:hypothetical protein